MKNILIQHEGTPIHIIEFENLREFIKIQGSTYVLKYEINENEAVYYSILDASAFIILAFVIDKNIKCENIRVENDKITPTNEFSGNTIMLAKVKTDTFLESILDIVEEEK